MKKYLKITIIDECGGEEIHNRVDSIDFFRRYANSDEFDTTLFKVEKLTDEEFKETEEKK